MVINPYNAKATYVQCIRMQKNLKTGCLHYFVFANLAASSIRVKKVIELVEIAYNASLSIYIKEVCVMQTT